MRVRQALPLLLIVGLQVLSAAGSYGQVVPGGGPAATDCFATYDSVPSANYPASNPKHVRCADQNALCGDADPRLGYCEFSLQVAFNSDNFAGCSPTNLPAGGFLIPYSGANNDDHPKNVLDFEVFQNFANDNLPLTPAMSAASGFSTVTVPMKLAFTKSGPMFRTTTIAMHPTMCTSPLNSSGKCVSPGLKDVDTFNLTCTAAVDANGDKISPCTGISGTLQQIQEHIFDRKCSAQPTCHGSATAPHDLCLKPSCNAGTRAAHTDLVGVDPANFPAKTDGLKRVAAGNPTSSLLIHKLNGGTQLNSSMFGTGAYGLRMPYRNPAANRARPKLSRAEIQLITDWITAGAPATGFVPTTAPGACGP